jgi:mannosyltransferase
MTDLGRTDPARARVITTDSGDVMNDGAIRGRANGDARVERVRLVTLAGIVALAALLRFVLLTHQSIWLDEAFVADVLRSRWQDIPGVLKVSDNHPPLYYLLMKAWTSIAGEGEIALRIPSVCFSTAAVALTYFLMRRLSSEATSLLAALIVAVSPLQVMAGQEARMYPLLELFAVASTLALTVAVIHPSWPRWAGYTLLAAGLVYTQYLGALVLVGQAAWLLLYERRRVREWLWSIAGITLLYLPWVSSFAYQTARPQHWFWAGRKLQDLADLASLYAFGGSLFGSGHYILPHLQVSPQQFVATAPFMILAGWGAATLDSRSRALIGLPIVLTVGVTSLALPALYPRWFSFLFPLYAGLLAAGLLNLAEMLHRQAAVSRQGAVAILAAASLVLGGFVLVRYYTDPYFRVFHWRDAAAFVAAQAEPHDLFLYVDSTAKLPFTYYYRRPQASMILTPVEASHQPRTFAAGRVRQLADEHPRVWVIATLLFEVQTEQRLIPLLSTAYTLVEHREFFGADVYLFQAGAKTSHGTSLAPRTFILAP